MKKEDIKNEKVYMFVPTGSVDTGAGWLESISDWLETLAYLEEEPEEDLPLIEVVKDASGQWVEA